MKSQLKSFLLDLAQDPLHADRFRAAPGVALDGTTLDPQQRALLARREETSLRRAVEETGPGAFIIMLVEDPVLDVARPLA